MSKTPNPITQGLRAVTRDPAIFLVEILWRWSFAILACLLVVGVGMRLLGPLHVGHAWDTAWGSRDPQRMAQLILAVLLLLGAKVIIAAAIALPLTIALLWSILSALGRFVTVKRLRAGLTSLPFRSIFALQLLRAFVGWFSVVFYLPLLLAKPHRPARPQAGLASLLPDGDALGRSHRRVLADGELVSVAGGIFWSRRAKLSRRSAPGPPGHPPAAF